MTTSTGKTLKRKHDEDVMSSEESMPEKKMSAKETHPEISITKISKVAVA
jgi:hypothetical protein